MAGLKKILLVDDEEDLREALAEQLAATEDFEVAEAGTGAGFDLTGYATQAGFLLGNQLPQCFETMHAVAADEATSHPRV